MLFKGASPGGNLSFRSRFGCVGYLVVDLELVVFICGTVEPSATRAKPLSPANVGFLENKTMLETTGMGSASADRDVSIIVSLSAALADGEM